MTTGRPSDYDPAYCDEAIAFLADGYSLAALAGKLSVTRKTIYNWMNEHPDFLHAVKTGQAKAALWWEQANRNLALTGQGNATSIIFGLKNRASDEWRDVKSTELTGKDGGPIQTDNKTTEVRRTIVDPQHSDPA